MIDMQFAQRQRQRNRVVLGTIIIAIGVLALLDNLGWMEIHRAREFWPLIFVVAGALKLQQVRTAPGGIVVGAGLIVVGTAMTMNNFGWMHFEWHDWWPLILILGGFHLMTRNARTQRNADGQAVEEEQAGAGMAVFAAQNRHVSGSRVDASVILSGCKIRSDSPDFQGGEINAVMGGVEVDLRNASISRGEAVLHVFAMWGGIALRVPPDWSVVVNGMPLLGGIEDKSVPPMTSTKRLVIDGYVIMGGVEIKN
jgi:predicted membrane protein